MEKWKKGRLDRNDVLVFYRDHGEEAKFPHFYIKMFVATDSVPGLRMPAILGEHVLV